MKSSKSVIDHQIAAYRDNFLLHGDTPLGTRQNDRLTQHIRFDALLRNLLPHVDRPCTLHDVGSGIADMYEYIKLRRLTERVAYSGTEIINEMVALTSSKYPEIIINKRDILDGNVPERYDFLVSSGMFNLPGAVEPVAWRDFCYQIIARMFELCDVAIAFNCLTTYKTRTDPQLHYFDPREIFDFCNKMSRFVTIDASYPLYEFTVTMVKKEHLKLAYPDESLKKYFAN